MSTMVTLNGVNTSDATATAAQILKGYTAYGAEGVKLTGTYEGIGRVEMLYIPGIVYGRYYADVRSATSSTAAWAQSITTSYTLGSSFQPGGSELISNMLVTASGYKQEQIQITFKKTCVSVYVTDGGRTSPYYQTPTRSLSLSLTDDYTFNLMVIG